MALLVRLLGVARAEHEGRSVAFVPDKRFLLLAYLACRGDWVSRDHLAFLFWPDVAPQDARKSLRHLLSRTRALEFARLESLDEQVRWAVETDVARFQASVAQGHWREAVGLYRGRLLEGLSPGLPDYEDWLVQEQEGLHNAYREALLNFGQQLEAQGRPAEAHALLAKALRDDPLAEDLVQAYLRTAAKSGKRAEALRGYEGFKNLLDRELRLEPLETTRQLAENLRLSPPVEPTEPPGGSRDTLVTSFPDEAPRLLNLPAQLTAFVGRDLDLSEIGGFVREPEIRLLTLVGPGGIGKTRLAVQVAQEQARHFRDGAVFVPLAGVDSPDSLPAAVAAALGLALGPGQSPQAQLEAHLKTKEMLLVLDNLEHLLAGAGLVSELLEAAPGLKVLATSREALDFYGEHRVEVGGLEVPPDPADPHLEVYDAVQLFVRSARRLNPRFALRASNRAEVARVCRMLHGSPLAIELATTWTRLLSVGEVIAEVQKSLDFLAVNRPDLPERHRSLRAVFEHSWGLLGPEEQTALLRLSAFRGGFRKEAGEQAGGVALRTLLALTNKSLLQRTAEGRFDLHPLVREFSEAKLAQAPALHAEQLERHGLYFFGFLEARAMGGPHDQQHLAEIEEDLENIRAAWGWAVAGRRAEVLERSADLVVFYDRRARFEEGANLFREAVEALTPTNPHHHAALGKAYVDSAWLYYRLGRLDRARAYAEQTAGLLGSSGTITLMKALNTLGEISRNTGQLTQARAFYTKALDIAREHGTLRAQSNYLNNLAIVEQNSGLYQQSQHHFEEVLALQKDLGSFETAMTLNNLGRLAVAALNLREADHYLQWGLQVANSIDFKGLIPYLFSNLGSLAFKNQDYSRAQSLCLQALQSMPNSTDSAVKATVFMNLGRTLSAIGKPVEAARYFRMSLEIVWPVRELPIVMENLVGLAELNFKLGNMGMTLELLNLAITHPATEPWFKRDAEELLEQLPKEKARVKPAEPTDEILTDLISRILV